jgi:hypothetical protein
VAEEIGLIFLWMWKPLLAAAKNCRAFVAAEAAKEPAEGIARLLSFFRQLPELGSRHTLAGRSG